MDGYGAGAIEPRSVDSGPSMTVGADDDDLAAAVLDDMMSTLGINQKKAKERQRAEHKYQKKGKKEKGRIKNKDAGVNTTAGGQGFLVGRRGGMMPAHLQAQVRSSVEDEW